MKLAVDMKHFTLKEVYARTPGFSLLLLLTGAEDGSARPFYLVALMLHFCSTAILLLVLYAVRISRIWCVVFAILASTPPFVEWATSMTTENLAEFTVAAMAGLLVAWIATRRTSLFIFFAFVGLYAAFTRPTFQVLAIAIAASLWLCRYCDVLPISGRRLASLSALALFISLAPQAAYSYLNYAKFDYFGMHSMAPYTLSQKVPGVLEFIPDSDARIREIFVRHRNLLMADPASDHTGQGFLYRAWPELLDLYDGDTIASLKKVQSLSMYLIKAKPMSYLNECTKAIGGYWMPNDPPLSSSSTARRIFWDSIQLLVIGIFFLQTLAVIGAALFHLPEFIRGSNNAGEIDLKWNFKVAAYIVGNGVIWYVMAVSCFGSIGLARYRVPTDLLIMAITLIGCSIWAGDRCRADLRNPTSTPSVLPPSSR